MTLTASRSGSSPLRPWRQAIRFYGLGRSLWMYWGNPLQLRRMRHFYAAFLGPGDLCFDIGAHAGNRTITFAALGARVVAAEPQPLFTTWLNWLCRSRPDVTVLPVAVGAVPGSVELVLSSATPTVTTASAGFLEAVAVVPSFAWVRWDERLTVPVVTLDELIARFGLPGFVKIDVEGMEPEVLDGLSQPMPALSFEFIPSHKSATHRCLARLDQLGTYRFNVSLGESLRFGFDTWQDRAAIEAWLDSRPAASDSGDIYARLEVQA